MLRISVVAFSVKVSTEDSSVDFGLTHSTVPANAANVKYRRVALRPGLWHAGRMCRNIRVLHNFDPPATTDEVWAAAVQYVRKVSGSSRPSAANRDAFDRAVAEIADATQRLLDALVTSAPAKDREAEAAKARARSAARFERPDPVS